MPGENLTTQTPSSCETATTGTPDGSALRVLLIENDTAEAVAVASRMRARDGATWVVETAATIGEARALLLELPAAPDCILLDLSLPDASGLEGIVLLGTAAPDVAVVVLADGGEEQLALAALAEGAQDVLSKSELDGDPAGVTLRNTVRRSWQRKRSGARVHSSTRLARSILDSIEAPTVALDGRGTIILTNAAWRSTAAMGGVSPSAVGAGVNYLDVCDRATGRDVAGVGAAATGIRGVLSGEAERFTIDYPCDSPTRARWFNMRVVPLGALGGGAVVTHMDITDIKRAERNLVVSDHELRDQVEHSAQLFLVVSADGVVQACSEFTRDLVGADATDIIGTDLGDWVHPADAEILADSSEEVMGRPGASVDAKLRIRDTSSRWHTVDIVLLNRIDDDRVSGIVVTGSDVSERERFQLLSQLEPRLLDQLPSALVVTDDAGVLVYWNERAATLFGIDADAVLGHDLSRGLDPVKHRETARRIAEGITDTGRWEGGFEVRLPDGTIVPLYATFDRIELPDIGFRGVIGTAVDNTERCRLVTELDRAAHVDELTGLPNRRRLEPYVTAALARTGPAGERCGVLLLGLDGLKLANEHSGFAAGDAVLRVTADAVQRVVPDGAMVARFLGDSLVVVIPTGPGGDEARRLADRIHRELSITEPIAEIGASPTVGIGIALGDRDDTVDSVMVEARLARARAKRAGRAQTVTYDPELEREDRHRAALEAQLAGAVDRNEIAVEYQAQVELGTGRIVGAEALVRWDHPHLGRLEPDNFLDLAERSGAIQSIDTHVMREASARAAVWREMYDPDFRISVNVSPRQLREPGLVRLVAQTLAATGLEATGLTLEITETTIIDDQTEATKTLNDLRHLGVAISIDDFGTGYSSLSYLKDLPADVVKIDRSFVTTICSDPRDRAIVSAVISLVDALGLDAIAEGVETEDQRDALTDLGCTTAQGFLWCRPMPAAEFSRLLCSGVQSHSTEAQRPEDEA